MSEEELSWMVSVMCIGGFIGNIFFGCTSNLWGRKLPLLSIAIPFTLSWILTFFATNPIYLYAARILGGFGGAGIFILNPLFVAEIAEDSKAEKALRFYRNARSSTSEEEEPFKSELEKLRTSNQIFAKDAENTAKISWSDVTSVTAKKAITIGIILIWLNQFCGCFAMLNYTATIFKDAGSSLSPNMSAIVVGVIQLIGAYISTFLVDRAGRK
ncbi:Facilitated trehalose transporter Tret1, partial [Pseudolycoriella hygida]